jgi:hypothetical protein
LAAARDEAGVDSVRDTSGGAPARPPEGEESRMDEEQQVQAIIASGYGFGAASIVAPRLLGKLYGFGDLSEQEVFLQRFAGVRNVALAQILTMLADEPKLRRRMLQVATAMFAADTAHALGLAVAGKVPRRGALMLAATTGVLGVLAAQASSD